MMDPSRRNVFKVLRLAAEPSEQVEQRPAFAGLVDFHFAIDCKSQLLQLELQTTASDTQSLRSRSLIAVCRLYNLTEHETIQVSLSLRIDFRRI